MIWADSTCETCAYLDYFFSGKKRYGRKRVGNELSPSLLNEWQCQGLIAQKDREKIEQMRKKRLFLDVNPEFSVYRDWDRDTVIELDKHGKLETDIIQKLVVPLATWGEQL